jgi:hypothetical protein
MKVVVVEQVMVQVVVIPCLHHKITLLFEDNDVII